MFVKRKSIVLNDTPKCRSAGCPEWVWCSAVRPGRGCPKWAGRVSRMYDPVSKI
ncbi:MAG: hypothetical protein WC721_11515 [Victivallaceae bacterium]